MLKYTGGDVAQTTDIMDVDTEFDLLIEYHGWIHSNAHSSDVGSESRHFFEGLWKEVRRDKDDVIHEWEGFDGGIIYRRCEDETYTVDCWTPDFQSVGSRSKDRVNIADNATDRSISPSYLSDSKINNLTVVLPDHLLTEHNPISSPTDEAEELAWLASLDASARDTASVPQRIARRVEPTPLALRLVSLHVEPSTAKAEYLATERWIDDID